MSFHVLPLELLGFPLAIVGDPPIFAMSSHTLKCDKDVFKGFRVHGQMFLALSQKIVTTIGSNWVWVSKLSLVANKQGSMLTNFNPPYQ